MADVTLNKASHLKFEMFTEKACPGILTNWKELLWCSKQLHDPSLSSQRLVIMLKECPAKMKVLLLDIESGSSCPPKNGNLSYCQCVIFAPLCISVTGYWRNSFDRDAFSVRNAHFYVDINIKLYLYPSVIHFPAFL